MDNTKRRLRQLIDWKATFIAGLVGGLASFLINVFVSCFVVGSGWLFIQLSASILLGEKIMHGEDFSDAAVVFLGLLIHITLSLIFAAILTTIIHRWGLIAGILGGAVFGLAVYGINFYLLSYYFPWFYPLRNWVFLLSHVLFGALVGGIYELLEVERYIIEEKEGQ